MRWWKPFQLLYFFYAAALFVALMIPVFLYALLVSPFGRIRGGNLVYEGCKVWADVWFFLVFIRHRNIFIEPLEKDASYIYVANHISYLDAAFIPKVFRHPVRPLGKVEMAKIPVFGFIYKNAIVTVDRSSPENRARSLQLLKATLRKGISVLVFPEGTFNMTHQPLKEFYDGAFRIAIETGTPIKPVLLLDTYSRMHYRSVFSLNPGRCRAVFLPKIEVGDYSPEQAALLRERVYAVMENSLRGYKAAWIDNSIAS
jgi:1-acyl-sn-glycerol-3-phosphate acyltransferase